MTQRLPIFRVSFLLLASLSSSGLRAQQSEIIDESFLLFLADGIEVDGEWQDPMTLSELTAIPNEELVWVAEREPPSIDAAWEVGEEIEDGEDND